MMTRRPLQPLSVINKTPELGKGTEKEALRSSRKTNKGNSSTLNEARLGSCKGTVKKAPAAQSRSRTCDATAIRVPFTIFEDNPSPVHRLKGKATQDLPQSGLKNRDKTTKQQRLNALKASPVPDQENVSKLQSAEKSVQYWKNLAETRRLVLEEALKENQKLYELLDAYKRENEASQGLAEKTKFLEELVEELSAQERAEIRHIGTQTDLCTGDREFDGN